MKLLGCAASVHRSLERLVEAGLLKREQVAPRAPWQIHRADLCAEPVQSILKVLRKTGKLVLPGGSHGITTGIAL